MWNRTAEEPSTSQPPSFFGQVEHPGRRSRKSVVNAYGHRPSTTRASWLGLSRSIRRSAATPAFVNFPLSGILAPAVKFCRLLGGMGVRKPSTTEVTWSATFRRAPPMASGLRCGGMGTHSVADVWEWFRPSAGDQPIGTNRGIHGPRWFRDPRVRLGRRSRRSGPRCPRARRQQYPRRQCPGRRNGVRPPGRPCVSLRAFLHVARRGRPARGWTRPRLRSLRYQPSRDDCWYRPAGTRRRVVQACGHFYLGRHFIAVASRRPRRIRHVGHQCGRRRRGEHLRGHGRAGCDLDR